MQIKVLPLGFSGASLRRPCKGTSPPFCIDLYRDRCSAGDIGCWLSSRRLNTKVESLSYPDPLRKLILLKWGKTLIFIFLFSPVAYKLFLVFWQPRDEGGNCDLYTSWSCKKFGSLRQGCLIRCWLPKTGDDERLKCRRLVADVKDDVDLVLRDIQLEILSSPRIKKLIIKMKYLQIFVSALYTEKRAENWSI